MRVIRVEEEPEYGVGLGSILVSLLEPEPGTARSFNRWYERDHYYAGCMTGEHFFSGRRYLATRSLRERREPKRSHAIPDCTLGSFLALYWIERGHHEETEKWAVDRVLWLGENGRMMSGRSAVHASFYRHRWAACRDEDGVPPEIALEHPFAGVGLLISERPEGVSAEDRERWLLETALPERLAGSPTALCLSLDPLQLPESSPVYVPPQPGAERRQLEMFFLDEGVDPEGAPAFETLAADLAAAQQQAGQGEVVFAAAFVPTVPGTDRYVDRV